MSVHGLDSVISLVGAVTSVLQAVLIVASIIYVNRQFGIVRACS